MEEIKFSKKEFPWSTFVQRKEICNVNIIADESVLRQFARWIREAPELEGISISQDFYVLKSLYFDLLRRKNEYAPAFGGESVPIFEDCEIWKLNVIDKTPSGIEDKTLVKGKYLSFKQFKKDFIPVSMNKYKSF